MPSAATSGPAGSPVAGRPRRAVRTSGWRTGPRSPPLRPRAESDLLPDLPGRGRAVERDEVDPRNALSQQPFAHLAALLDAQPPDGGLVVGDALELRREV